MQAQVSLGSLMISEPIKIYPLGQVGYLWEFVGERIVIDPYLGDSVAEQFGEALRRRYQPTLSAQECSDVAWILLTHAHLDHTDPASLKAILAVSPRARVAAPADCLPVLQSIGLPASRLHIVDAGEKWPLSAKVEILAIPAAHTALDRDDAGRCRYLGYHLTFDGLCFYHAGDTVPHEAIFTALRDLRVDYAFLPVNERNYFRDLAGIVGNMTPREAFALAEQIGARVMVPTHWDLFGPNSTSPWEVEALHDALKPAFRLRFMPCGAVYST